MSYDSPNYLIRREHRESNVTGVASTSVRKILMFQAAKLKKVHALVVTAGTNTAAGFDILVGTTSVGEVTLGTNTAGYSASSALLNADVPAMGVIDLKGKANSATLVASFSVEHEVDPSAVES